MRKKAITTNCAKCEKMEVNDRSQMTCKWGKGKKAKILEPQKGKKPLYCNLIKETL